MGRVKASAKTDELLEENQDIFKQNLNSVLAVKRDYERKTLNDEWIDLFEEIIPYLDNILRNPKRFIVNDEEIVKVELAKKITVESVIHLTQHTNLIQDYDPKSGDVKPSKILNINKDESLDTYENRFIFTLLNNMNMFYEQRVGQYASGNSFHDKVDLQYDASTKLGSEDVKISISLNTLDKGDQSKSDHQGLSLQERLAKIKIQLDGFRGTELFQTLSKLHVPPVRSPIRKTNVILKNPNFQKASELWNFIQSYEKSDYELERDNQNYFDVGPLKEQFDQSFLLNYMAKESIASNATAVTEKKLITLTINRLVENLLEYDLDIDDEKVKEIFERELRNAKAKMKAKEEVIAKIFNDKFDGVNKQFLDACFRLEKG